MAGGGHKGGTASLRGAARRQLDRPLRGCTKADDGGGSGDAALGGGLFGNGTDLYGAEIGRGMGGKGMTAMSG
jgi:hypothetical protein